MSLVEKYHRAHLDALSRLWPTPQRQEPKKVAAPPPPKPPPVIKTVKSRPVVIPIIWEPELAERVYVTVDQRPKIEFIRWVVCRHFGITLVELDQQRRFKDVTFRRAIAIYLCAKLTTQSLPRIGRKFGGHHHTTVMHARDRIANRRAVDPDLDLELDLLEYRIVRRG